MPGLEFDAVELELGAALERREVTVAETGEDWGAGGVRVGELALDAAGTVDFEVRLVQDSRSVLVRRGLVQVNGRVAVTVLLTRSCVGVTCPSPGGDANAEACLGGRCLSAECIEGSESQCGGDDVSQCTGAADCAAPVDACATAECVNGACLYLASTCEAGLYCDPDQGCVAPMMEPPADWWDLDWSHRVRMDFDNEGRDEDLVDFPVMVALDSSRIEVELAGENGESLRFLDDDGETLLDHEIETWNPNGRSTIWVRVPQIDRLSDTDHIWLYYGADVADAQNRAGVWSDAYVAVWHLDLGTESSPTTTLRDSSPTGVSGTAESLDDSARVETIAGRGLLLSGSNHTIRVPGTDEAFDFGTDPFTVSAWIRTSSDQGECAPIVGRFVTADIGFEFCDRQGGGDQANLWLSDSDGNAHETFLPPVTDGQWHYLAGVKVGTMATAYLDGADPVVAETTFSGHFDDDVDWTIGCRDGFENCYQGELDEVRFAKRERSPLWLEAQNASLRDTLISYRPMP